MRKALHLLFAVVLGLAGLSAAQAQERAFNQAELDALLAPIALYPDPVLNNVLDASLYPQELALAADWMRANPQLQGDAALATVQNTNWQPSVKALVAYPDILIRMAESPQWLADLAAAYASAPQYVDATVQQLRARAAANGYLRSDEYQTVYQSGPAIVVQPVYPTVAYVRYYDPYVVYGPWWWPAYRPVYFRPWIARPVFAHRFVQPLPAVRAPVHGPVVVRAAPVIVKAPVSRVTVTPYRAIPESQRRPIIQSQTAPVARPSISPGLHSPAKLGAVPSPQNPLGHGGRWNGANAAGGSSGGAHWSGGNSNAGHQGGNGGGQWNGGHRGGGGGSHGGGNGGWHGRH